MKIEYGIFLRKLGCKGQALAQIACNLAKHALMSLMQKTMLSARGQSARIMRSQNMACSYQNVGDVACSLSLSLSICFHVF